MKKILLVDDEKGVVAMMKSYFEMSGYQVLTAYNGAEALRQAVHQPDIILLDINMPGMDGLTVCKKIRDYISCPILFLTARIETADKIHNYYLFKILFPIFANSKATSTPTTTSAIIK